MLAKLLAKLIIILLFFIALMLGYSNQQWLSLSFLGFESLSLPVFVWLLLAWFFGMVSYWLLNFLSSKA